MPVGLLMLTVRSKLMIGIGGRVLLAELARKSYFLLVAIQLPLP